MPRLNGLRVGWRFSPTDEELINYFLARKINGKDDDDEIGEIDLLKWDPWELPGQSILKSDDKEWFFFCLQDQKHPGSSRFKRSTRSGFWKSTGQPRNIKSKKKVIGEKKTLVFHKNKKRTCWVIHEYRATSNELNGTHPGQRPFVLCRLFKNDDESVQDANENDAELPTPSPNPYDHLPVNSPINSNPELVSQQVVPFAVQECTKKFSSAENRNDVDECCKTPSQETVSDAKCHVECHRADSEDLEDITKSMEKQPQTDVIIGYDELFADLDPKDMILFDSTTPESMGSSLIQHSTNSDFFVNESLRLDGNENELDQYNCNVLQSLLANSPDNSCEDQGNNLISIDDYEIPNERMSLYDDDTPGMIIAASWMSNTDETEQGQMVMEHEQSELDYCATSDNQVSTSHVNVSNPDQACHSGIQIRRRQPQVGLAIDNNDKPGIAQRRIRLQAKYESLADYGTDSDDEWRGFIHDSEQPDTYNEHGLMTLQSGREDEPVPDSRTPVVHQSADSHTELDDNRNVSERFINENPMLIYGIYELQAYCGTGTDNERNVSERFIPKKHVLQSGNGYESQADSGTESDESQGDSGTESDDQRRFFNYEKQLFYQDGDELILLFDYGTDSDDEGRGFTHDSEQSDIDNKQVMTLQGGSGYESQSDSGTESDDQRRFYTYDKMLFYQDGDEVILLADYGTDSDDEWRGFTHDSEQPDTDNKQVMTQQGGSEPQAESRTESIDNQTVSKKFISSVISSFKPSQMRISYKLMIVLSSAVTIFIAYAGFRGYLGGRSFSLLNQKPHRVPC